MRPFLLLLTAVLFVATSQLHSQTAEWCGFDEHQQVSLTETGGAYMPSFGTVKALMIFIDFSDDTTDVSNQTWPVGIGPGYVETIIDPDEGAPSGIHANITTYFNDMSFDNLHLIGTGVYRQARYSWATYLNNAQWRSNIAYWAMRHVIEDLDEEGFDFSDYDRWTRRGAYNIEPGPDGVVDMVFACYRLWYTRECFVDNNDRGFIAEGWADLGCGGNFTVDKGERTIQSCYPGSGVTALRMREYAPSNPRLEHVEHEFGHYLGLPHNYDGGLWSLMGHRYPNISSFMNSFEREQMGWIAFHDVGINGLLVDMQDFGTTGVAYRLTIPGTSESFLIENHQILSQYDLVDVTAGGAPGIYILHRNGGQLQVVAADGRWNWSNPFWIHNPWSTNPQDSIPVYKRDQVNRVSGRTDKKEIPHTKNGSSFIHAWLDEQTGQLATPARRTFGLGKSRFTFDENNMFSPWGGYAAYNWNGSAATTLGVEVVSNQPQNKIRVRFYATTPMSGPPSKPMDSRIAIVNSHPSITWAAMQEPDVLTGGKMLIHRRTKTLNHPWNAWGLFDSTSGTATQYTDLTITTNGTGTDSVQYRIQAKDSTARTSSYSDVVSTKMNAQSGGGGTGKIVAGSGAGDLPKTFDLASPYPNPFNPSTTIKYQLPEDGFVILTVFDVVGREVTTLVNGPHAAGYYSTAFTTERFASGVYFARLTVTNRVGAIVYQQMTKLMLMK